MCTDGALQLGGVDVAELVERYGTPLYVLDENEFRARARRYRQLFPQARIHYAAKAFLCREVARWAQSEGLGIDVCSLGELTVALAAGIAPGDLILHGNAKSPEELAEAVRVGVGRIVLDDLSEVQRIAALVPRNQQQAVLIRVVPGVSAGAHAAVRTGVQAAQFGLSTHDGSAEEAVRRVLEQPRLLLAGLHCHLGSQITGVTPYLQAIDELTRVLAVLRDRHAVHLPELNIGGGHAVAYRRDDPELDLDRFARSVPQRLAQRCEQFGLPVPQLVLEPGRAIAGPSAIAVYRVLAVKIRKGGRRFAAVDGGMSDNPRPALYGVRYTVRHLGRSDSGNLLPTAVVGRHCETGDVINDRANLPADLHPGDLLSTPVAGAYHRSMASTYNLVGRPPVIAVRDGAHRVLIRRETVADLLAQDED
jgi:diaminopimelate decarboxylase